MLRKLLPLLLLAPLAARAQSDWDDGQWSGDDQVQLAGRRAERGRSARRLRLAAVRLRRPSSTTMARSSTALLLRIPPAPAPSIDDFRSGLDRYGRWVETPEYGWVVAADPGELPVAAVLGRPLVVDDRGLDVGHRRAVGLGERTTTGAGLSSTASAGAGCRDASGALPGWPGVGAAVYAGWCPLGPRGVVYAQAAQLGVRRVAVLHDAGSGTHAVPVSVVATVWTRAQPMPIIRPSPRAGPPPRVVEQHTRMPVRAVPIVEAESRTPRDRWPPGAFRSGGRALVPYSRPRRQRPGRVSPLARSPLNQCVAGRWREQFPAAQQPRPAAPAAQQARPAAPAAQPVHPAAPAVRLPAGARPTPAPRAEREERGPSGRPHAQPLNEAREAERK